jgi:PleD family two-component response regulator
MRLGIANAGAERGVKVPVEWIAPSHRVAHVLIADDDSRVRTMLSRYLMGEGFRVSEATDGATTRKGLADRDVDLVVLDLMLPGEGGGSHSCATSAPLTPGSASS